MQQLRPQFAGMQGAFTGLMVHSTSTNNGQSCYHMLTVEPTPGSTTTWRACRILPNCLAIALKGSQSNSFKATYWNLPLGSGWYRDRRRPRKHWQALLLQLVQHPVQLSDPQPASSLLRLQHESFFTFVQHLLHAHTQFKPAHVASQTAQSGLQPHLRLF